MNNPRVILVGVIFVLTACSSKPTFVNHTAPNLPVVFDEFTNAGCPTDSNGQPCGAVGPLADFGCNDIYIPSNLTGGLDPAYPIAICQIDLRSGAASAEIQAKMDRGDYLYYLGGLSGSYVRYVIFKDGEFRLLKTEEDFRNAYAPIDSPEEALSYVLAVTTLSAVYGLEYDPAMKYEVNEIEDTFVTAETDGYRLHLFYDQVFGCGPHWITAIDTRISFDGTIQEISQTQLFRDPNMDELCVD